MATLSIHILKPDLGIAEYGDSVGLSAALVARATQLLDDGGHAPEQPESHDLLLSIDGRAYSLGVSPGLWGVELALPSGQLVARQTRVGRGEDAPLEFDLGESPRKWLAWQFVEGSVPERDRYRAVLEHRGPGILQSPRGVRMGASKRALAPAVRNRVRKSFDSPIVESAAFALSNSPAAPSRAQVTMLRYRPEAQPPGVGYQAKFERARAQWQALVCGLALEQRILDLPGLETDPDHRFEPGENDPWHQAWHLRVPDHDAFEDRRFALVVTNRAIELVALPLPWPMRRRIADRNLIELVIDKSDVERPSRTSVTLRDEGLFGLLSYLKTGAMALAARVAEQGDPHASLLVEALREKRENPLGACAAAYALLAATDPTLPQPWHPWLENLSNWFSWLPDGAIMHGRWQLASGTGDPADAKRAFLRAFRRGIPYYALGLDWLLDGLRQFPDDAVCIEAARLVREVSLRSDVSQVFTVLNFHTVVPLAGDAG